MLVPLMLAAVQMLDPIGSGLGDGVRLVYSSGGVEQEPWAYEAVRLVDRAEFDRCVDVRRAGQQAREYCARGDTLFERRASGEHEPIRPLGPNMVLQVRTASGSVLHYSTGSVLQRSVAGRSIDCVETTIVTRAADGAIVRRLHEQYAPSLLTAVHGTFEEPRPDGGWNEVRAFELTEIRWNERGGGSFPGS